ncbi:hypothetical protein GWK47_029042 [Chionoecetes opilio]|uniref:Uncharacterized protein n=1 Tax=Chionoecetes opilio TaxID=41210 RepID=A0A8J5D274_CHIOP|nr:hypothetical protein GWK47_029042 [Chionoecetes opilio]
MGYTLGQVNFSPEKHGERGFFLAPRPGGRGKGGLRFGGVLSHSGARQGSGSKVDRELRFEGPKSNKNCKKGLSRSLPLRRVKFLDRGGKLLLYKAQIGPYLEYAALSWMSCAPHIGGLDSTQRRPWWWRAAPPDPPTPHPVGPGESLDSLKPQGCRGACGIPQGTGRGSHGPGLHSLRESPAEHENGAHGDAVEVRFLSQPAPTPLFGPRLQDVNIFTAVSLTPRDEHTK